MVRDAEVAVETVVTNGEGVDHASAISLLGPDDLDARARLLVVYANPAADRRPWPDTVLADRVRIGSVDEKTEAEDGAGYDTADDGSEPAAGLSPVDLAVVETVPATDVRPGDVADAPVENVSDGAPDDTPDETAVAPDDEPADGSGTVLYPNAVRRFGT